MSLYSNIYNLSIVRKLFTFNPWDLFTSTQTYEDYISGIPVSKYRMEFLMAAAGIGGWEEVSYHGWGIRGLPGAKYHAMNGQSENTHLIRKDRAGGKDFRERVVLQHPDYYKFALMR